MGNSSRDTSLVGMVRLGDTVLTEQCANRMIILECNRDKLSFLTQKDYAGCHLEDRCEKKPDGGVTGMAVISVTEEDILAGLRFSMVKENRLQQTTTRQDIRDMFLRQLRKKGSSPFSIKTARPGSAVLPGRRKCS